ncbi:hypothetical protein C3L33_20757, partial [Rhododendron williamsianum]
MAPSQLFLQQLDLNSLEELLLRTDLSATAQLWLESWYWAAMILAAMVLAAIVLAAIVLAAMVLGSEIVLAAMVLGSVPSQRVAQRSPRVVGCNDREARLANSVWFFQLVGVPEVLGAGEVKEIEDEGILMKKKKGGLRLKIKVGNPSLRRLISRATASAVSMTSVTPLETMMTHLMVGSCGHSSTEVFQDIMKNEGWTGLFRGNLVNVIRVAPSKAIEVWDMDTSFLNGSMMCAIYLFVPW